MVNARKSGDPKFKPFKPRHISSFLDVPVKDFYSAGSYIRRAPRVPFYRCPEIIEAVRTEIHSIGLRKMNLNRIQAAVASKPLARKPGRYTIRRILHERFGLTFKDNRTDLARYNDELLDEKRIWISRLLVQFMMDDVVIISVDESGFQSGYGPGLTWQPTTQF